MRQLLNRFYRSRFCSIADRTVDRILAFRGTCRNYVLCPYCFPCVLSQSQFFSLCVSAIYTFPASASLLNACALLVCGPCTVAVRFLRYAALTSRFDRAAVSAVLRLTAFSLARSLDVHSVIAVPYMTRHRNGLCYSIVTDAANLLAGSCLST